MQTYYLIHEMQAIIDAMEEKRLLTPQGNFYKKTSIRNWRSRLTNFEDYQNYLGNNIVLNEINHRWCEDYHLYLLNKGYAKNSIGNILSTLRALIKRMHREEKMQYSGSGIRCSMETTTAVFTSINELRILIELNLKDTTGIERVRDIYVMQCFLGLRLGDMMKFVSKLKLYLKEIDGVKVFEIKTNKTGEVVVIPAAKIVLQIAERRNFELGKIFSQQYYSEAIKSIIVRAGLDRNIIFHRTEGGEAIERVMRYSDLIGTHTARRTFATNAYLSGINPLDIMKITGHKSFTSFFKYIRCDNLAVALRIANHSFFNIDFNEAKTITWSADTAIAA